MCLILFSHNCNKNIFLLVEMQQDVEAREGMMVEVKRVQEKLTKNRDELHSFSLEMEQKQGVINAEVKEHGRDLQDHADMLRKHDKKLAIMHTKQTNASCRVSYAVKEITHLAQHQRETTNR